MIGCNNVCYLSFKSKLSLLRNVKIPKKSLLELHGFSDALPIAYEAVAHFRALLKSECSFSIRKVDRGAIG